MANIEEDEEMDKLLSTKDDHEMLDRQHPVVEDVFITIEAEQLGNTSFEVFRDPEAYLQKTLTEVSRIPDSSGKPCPSAYDGSKEQIITAIIRDDSNMLDGIRKKEPSYIKDAVEYNSFSCLKILLEHYEKNHASLPEVTCSPRHFSLNWPVNERSKVYPLHILASRISCVNLIQLFDKSKEFMKKNVDMIDSQGATPLLVAVRRKNVEVALFLIKHKAKIDFLDPNGDSPIKLAALNGLSEVLTTMLEEHRSHEEKDLLEDETLYGEGHTLLYWAAKSCHGQTVNSVVYKYDEEHLDSLLKKEMNHEKNEDTGEFVCNIWSFNLLTPALREKHKDNLNKLDKNKVTPLMRAAERGEHLVVREILETQCGKNTIGNVDCHGRTVFHYGYNSVRVIETLLNVNNDEMSSDKPSDDRSDKDVNNDEMSSDKPADDRSEKFVTKEFVNARDKKGKTALELVAYELKENEGNTRADDSIRKCFRILLQCIPEEKGRDLFRHPYVGYTSLSILKMILNDWETFQPNNFEKFILGTDGFPPPLIGAVIKNDIEIIKFLIENGANVEQLGFDDNTVLHYAASSDSNLKILEYLLEVKKIKNQLDNTNDCGVSPVGCAVEAAQTNALICLLKQHPRLTGDGNGGNVLDCGYGNFEKEGMEDTLMEILEYCDNNQDKISLKKLMENSYFGPDRLLAKLVEDSPRIALEILNRCKHRQTITRHARSGEKRDKTKIVYQFYALNEEGSEKLSALSSMVENGRDECLAHPVVKKFLAENIKSVQVRMWLNMNLGVYLWFLVSLTTYTGLHKAGSYDLDSPGMVALSIGVLILCLVNLVKELFQLVHLGFKSYFSYATNCMELVCYICTIVYIVNPVEGHKTTNQIEAGAISILLAWLNFIWFLERFEKLGLQIIMMNKVLNSVVPVLPMAFLFMVGFALAFRLIMPEDPNNAFRSIPYSFLTTAIMMSGEIDYRDVFLTGSPFGTLQKILLLIFILVLVIVLMNLLIGIAVDDIGGIIKQSEANIRLSKAKLILDLHKLLHSVPMLSKLSFIPNSENDDREKLHKVLHFLNAHFKAHANDDEEEEKEEDEKEDSKIRMYNIEKQLDILCSSHQIMQGDLETVKEELKQIEEKMGMLDNLNTFIYDNSVRRRNSGNDFDAGSWA